MLLLPGARLAFAAPPDDPAPTREGEPGSRGPASDQPGQETAPQRAQVAPPMNLDGTLGFSGKSPLAAIPHLPNIVRRDALPVPDRWRLEWPRWDRYGRMSAFDPLLMNATGGDSPYTLGNAFNPYDRNVLKGDYPILGDDIFLNASLISDTLIEYRRLPTPSGVSTSNPGSEDFFGDGEQFFLSQTILASVDIFRGNTAFRPVDWLFRVTGAYNFNYLELRENNAVNIDVREGDSRTDDYLSLQEAFFEYHLGDVSPMFDVAAFRLGRQLFISDFRGFIFSDVADGLRLLGNTASNRIQYNLAYFNQLEKDTNSELVEPDWRDQQVLIANMFIQDFIWPGYTTQFSFHWNHDQSDTQFDDNGFVVIPDPVGSFSLHDIDAYYLGWTGDGHIDRLNINHALYYAFGEDSNNPLAGRPVDISAFMGAVELSVDIDWLRPKFSFFYASGDTDPEDGTAEGFDGIFDNPFFVGGPSSFFQRQAFRAFGVDLTSARSLYLDLAAAKSQGQSNFVNPGTMIVNAGLDAELTPKLRSSLNCNFIWFAQTETVETLFNQNDIERHFGEEINLVVQYRPFLNNNTILTVGGSMFFPGQGFDEIFEDDDDSLFQVFAGITLAY